MDTSCVTTVCKPTLFVKMSRVSHTTSTTMLYHGNVCIAVDTVALDRPHAIHHHKPFVPLVARTLHRTKSCGHRVCIHSRVQPLCVVVRNNQLFFVRVATAVVHIQRHDVCKFVKFSNFRRVVVRQHPSCCR